MALGNAEIRRARGRVVVCREARLVLEQSLENTRRRIAVLPESCVDERAIRRTVATFAAAK